MKQLRLLILVTILSVLSSGCLCSNYQKAKNVIVLTDNNFEEVSKEFPTILIHFYTPWCGVCKKLSPEYSKAALVLEKENIALGQLNSSVNKNITKAYDIQKFPTLKLFINGGVIDYIGENNERDIINFMKKKAGPLIRTLTSVNQIEEFINAYNVIMIYFGESKEHLEIIEDIAQNNTHYTIGKCSEPKIFTHYNLTGQANFVMFKTYDEKRYDYNLTEGFTKEKIIEFILYYYLPKAMYFDQNSAQVIFGSRKPGLFLYRTKHFDKRELYEDILSNVADKLNRELQVIVTGLSEDYESRIAFFFGITAEDLPAIYIHDTRKRIKTYKMKGEINEETILAFVDQWRRDELIPIWKSEEVPTEQGVIYQIVGKTYENVVLKSKRDVLILFLSPYEESMREFWYSYRDIAIKNKNNDELLVAYVHSTHNDIESVELSSVPSLYLWRAKKKELLLYEGKMTMRDVELFLKENSIYPFEIKEEEKKQKEGMKEENKEEDFKTNEVNNTIKEDL